MRTANAKNDQIRDQKKAKRIAYWKQYWVMYTMLALTVAYYIIFRYIPMAGNTLAFHRYVPGKGMFGTEWTMRYVERFLKDPVFWKAFKITLVLVICLVPFMYVLSASFSGPKPLTNGEVFLFPKDFTLNAYVKIIQYPNFLRSYGNTILYTVVGTGICLVMTIFMAFPLAHPKLKGHGFFMKLVVITMFFSGGLIPKFLLVNSLKTTDTIWAIVLPVAINTFNLIVLINFFKTIPRELEEAALIDGMGYFGIMRNIFLPLSIPALATITLYYAVYFRNDWFIALIYVKSARYPVMMILRNLVMGTTQMDVGSMSSEGDTVSIAMKCAVIVTSSVPIIVLYPFLSKYFVKGLTIGCVKG